MSSNRLNELRRQRDAIQAHLHWLDAEIARETPQGTPRATPAPDVAQPPVEIPPGPATINYEPDPVSAAAAARKGCLIWVLALILLGLALISAIYFWRYRDHPLFLPRTEATSRAAALTRSA